MNTLTQWLEGKKIRNNPKGYDGNDLKSAGDYYGIAAESWAEVIRYEDGHDSAISALQADSPLLLSTMEAEIKERIGETEEVDEKLLNKKSPQNFWMKVGANQERSRIHTIIHEYFKTQE